MSRVAAGCRASETGEGGTVGKWLVAGLLMLLAAFGLAVVAAGEGTLPGDIAIAQTARKQLEYLPLARREPIQDGVGSRSIGRRDLCVFR